MEAAEGTTLAVTHVSLPQANRSELLAGGLRVLSLTGCDGSLCCPLAVDECLRPQTREGHFAHRFGGEWLARARLQGTSHG